MRSDLGRLDAQSVLGAILHRRSPTRDRRLFAGQPIERFGVCETSPSRHFAEVTPKSVLCTRSTVVRVRWPFALVETRQSLRVFGKNPKQSRALHIALDHVLTNQTDFFEKLPVLLRKLRTQFVPHCGVLVLTTVERVRLNDVRSQRVRLGSTFPGPSAGDEGRPIALSPRSCGDYLRC